MVNIGVLTYVYNVNKLEILDKLQQLFGEDKLIQGQKLETYLKNTLDIKRNVVCVIQVDNASEIPSIVQLANVYHTPIYTISTGHNWGYGCSMPVVDDCIILDLHKLTKITIIDPIRGLFELEPGVTQGMLRQFLDQQHLNFMVPTTGAGPSCSLIGNALERGYGLTPTISHINAITSYEAVLPNGEIYKSPFKLIGCELLSHYYPYGLGPYIDALFSHSNFGIVTKATFVLKVAPEHFEIVYFGCRQEQKLETMVEYIHLFLQKYPDNIPAINLINKNRMKMTLRIKDTKQISKYNIFRFLTKSQDMEWIAIGGLFGTKKIINVIKKDIKKLASRDLDRLIFVSNSKINFLNKIAKLNFFRNSEMRHGIEQLDQIRDLLLGKPNEFQIKAIYNSDKILENEQLNPSIQNIGLIWFAPLIPLVPNQIRRFVNLVYEISAKHLQKPKITLSSKSDLCFDCTIIILFDKNNKSNVASAKQYFQDLFDGAHQAGFYPYRLDVDTMKQYTQMTNSYSDIVDRIFTAVDPNSILSPGRYRKP